MFIRRSHGCMNDSVLPSDEMRKYARSGLRKKSRIGMELASCADAVTVVMRMVAASRFCKSGDMTVCEEIPGAFRRAFYLCTSAPAPDRGEPAASGSSAARIAGGIGTGRWVARSTQTWTKRPFAAGSSSPSRNNPIS